MYTVNAFGACFYISSLKFLFLVALALHPLFCLLEAKLYFILICYMALKQAMQSDHRWARLYKPISYLS